MTLTLTSLVLLGAAALLVGFAKTAIGGVSSIAVAIFALVMPARESTAAILLLLLDVVAVWHYRRHADLAILRRLVPTVQPGLLLGALFLAWADGVVLRRGIGVILLLLAAFQLVLVWRAPDTSRVASSTTAAVGTGVAAGFTTMTANAAAPVMAIYLVARGVEKVHFLGTAAVFFFVVNACKVPFSAALGLFTRQALLGAVLLSPLVLVGTWVGAAHGRPAAADQLRPVGAGRQHPVGPDPRAHLSSDGHPVGGPAVRPERHPWAAVCSLCSPLEGASA